MWQNSWECGGIRSLGGHSFGNGRHFHYHILASGYHMLPKISCVLAHCQFDARSILDCHHPPFGWITIDCHDTAFIVLHRRWRHETRIWCTEYSLIILSHIVLAKSLAEPRENCSDPYCLPCKLLVLNRVTYIGQLFARTDTICHVRIECWPKKLVEMLKWVRGAWVPDVGENIGVPSGASITTYGTSWSWSNIYIPRGRRQCTRTSRSKEDNDSGAMIWPSKTAGPLTWSHQSDDALVQISSIQYMN
jgi:hypothetical protein